MAACTVMTMTGVTALHASCIYLIVLSWWRETYTSHAWLWWFGRRCMDSCGNSMSVLRQFMRWICYYRHECFV